MFLLQILQKNLFSEFKSGFLNINIKKIKITLIRSCLYLFNILVILSF